MKWFSLFLLLIFINSVAGVKLCSKDSDCDDSSDCTIDSCVSFVCVNLAISLPSIGTFCKKCATNSDCSDDNTCTYDVCFDFSPVFNESRCLNIGIENRANGTDCPDDGDPCTDECYSDFGSTKMCRSVRKDGCPDPSVAFCTPEKPVWCKESKTCVASADLCLGLKTSLLVCNSTHPFPCFNELRCESDFANCFKLQYCPSSKPFVCWDGECAKDASHCSPLASCPLFHIRAPNGTCVPLESASFDSKGTCPLQGEECYDFNGCPVGFIYCPSGICGESLADCQGSCPDSQYQCWDKSCQSDSSKCIQPPHAQKPLGSDTLIKQSEVTVLEVPVIGYGVLCTVSIPPETICAEDEINSCTKPVSLSIRAVADSYAKQITGLKSWNGEAFFANNLRVSVLNITSNVTLKMPFPNPVTISCKASFLQNENASLIFKNFTLGFIDEVNKSWVSVDKNLSLETGNILKGYTTHFTSFGLLLGDSDGGDSGGDQGSSSTVIAGIAGGLIAFTVLVIAAAVFGYFFYKKKISLNFRSMLSRRVNESKVETESSSFSEHEGSNI